MSKFIEITYEGNRVLVNIDLITFLNVEKRAFGMASGELHRINEDDFLRILKALQEVEG